LDPARTSPYQMYQFFLNVEDRDVGQLLRYLSLRSPSEIEGIVARSGAAPEKREAQRELAREITGLVHGEHEARNAEASSTALFGGIRLGGEGSVQVIRAIVNQGASSSKIRRKSLEGEGWIIVGLLSDPRIALSSSMSAARRDIAGGGIYLNESRLEDPAYRVTTADLIDGQYVVLRKGKKTFHILRAVGDDEVSG